MDPVHILYATFDSKLDADRVEHYMDRIPMSMQHSLRKFLNWEDTQVGLFGKLLLAEGIRQLGINKHVLENIRYNAFNRPFLPACVDFNISHSSHIAVCALSRQYKVGIDIEKIKALNIQEFTGQFTSSELDQINNAVNPLQEFYSRWTKKESVIKADGRGMNFPLKNIIFENPLLARVEDLQWHLHAISIHDDYCCHVATNCQESDAIKIQKIDIEQCYGGETVPMSTLLF